MNSMKKFYILIAEDDADDRFLLKTAFEESGYKNTLKFVENGVELIRHLKEVIERKTSDEFPAFILLDLKKINFLKKFLSLFLLLQKMKVK